MNLWKQLHKGLKNAGGKTSDFTKIGRIKIDVLGIKKEMEEKFIELGGRVYQLMGEEEKNDYTKNKEINHIVEQIHELERELNAYDAEIKRIKKLSEEDGR